MKKVKVKGIGVQVQGISYFKNDVFKVEDEDYENIKDLVEILEEDTKVNQKVITINVEDIENINVDEIKKELEKHLQEYVKKVKEIEEKEKSSQLEKEELNKLKEKAKELGIKNASRINKEKLQELIAEKEAPMFGEKQEGENQNQNSEEE